MALRHSRMRPPRLPRQPLPPRLGVERRHDRARLCSRISIPTAFMGHACICSHSADDVLNSSRGAFVGNYVYFMIVMGSKIFKYDMAKHHLFVIDLPES
jgi:hypothetical protein